MHLGFEMNTTKIMSKSKNSPLQQRHKLNRRTYKEDNRYKSRNTTLEDFRFTINDPKSRTSTQGVWSHDKMRITAPKEIEADRNKSFRSGRRNRRKTRIEKARLLLKSGKYPVRFGEGDNYYVPSQSGRGKYFVMKNQDGWSCDCIDFMKRHTLCKHCYAVILWKSQEHKPIEESKSDEELVETYVCKFCKSWDIIKYGIRCRKQVYFCKECNRRFVNNQYFEKMKYDPDIIALTLDLYFMGNSLREIADLLERIYGLSLTHVAIFYWIEKYIRIMDAYVSTLEPKELSDVWHIDEMSIKIGGDWKWLWNTIDEGARFQLASHISKERYIEDARNAFQKAKNNGRHRKPKYIISDGLPSYKIGRAHV